MNSYKSVIVGLGAMGMGVAQSSIRAGINTIGCDVRDEALFALTQAGGIASKSLAEAAINADAVAIVVVNADQSEAVLFGADGLVEGLSKGSVVLGCATVSADYARSICTRLATQDILYLDAPISGGSIKSAKGEHSVIASGSTEAFKKKLALC